MEAADNTSILNIQPFVKRVADSQSIHHEVQVLGDRAYAHGTYEFELTPKEGGATKSYSGKFLDILEKQADGSWKIAIDCFNFDAPAA